MSDSLGLLFSWIIKISGPSFLHGVLFCVFAHLFRCSNCVFNWDHLVYC